MADSRVRVTEDDGVFELVMGHPPVNAFSQEFLRLVNDAAAGIPEDAGAVIVHSTVDRIFAAGGDIPMMASAPIEELLAYVRFCQETYSAFERMAAPSIAAIDGAAFGGGVELALACDVRIIGESAKLGLPEVQLGIIPGAGGTQRLGRTIGGGLARDLLLTGRRFTGREAGAMGLASRVVPDGEALATSRAIARELADGARPAIRVIKRLAVEGPDVDLEEGLAHERRAWEIARTSPEGQEGLEAFATRRKPDFRGARERAKRP